MRLLAFATWAQLRQELPSLESEPYPITDAVHHLRAPPDVAQGEVVLYRERNGWCPYSERVWLTLEMLNVRFHTILIDNTGGSRPSWFTGTTPRIRWEDGTEQGESMDIVKGIDDRYGGGLYPPDTQRLIAAFRDTFPRPTRPSSRAAFLFRSSGAPVSRRDFETTLQATDALLAGLDGPLFGGRRASAADVAWAPFLERYAAQLPLLHDGLRPRDADAYPHLAAWYDAMETKVPAYFARVRGDARSWAKVLAQAGYGNGGHVPEIIAGPTSDERDPDRDMTVWRSFGWDRDGVGRTPSREAATRIVRNYEAIVKDAVRTRAAPDAETADDGLRRCVALLLNADSGNYDDIDDAGAALMATYLAERICVPRDMGAPPAATIHALRAALNRD